MFVAGEHVAALQRTIAAIESVVQMPAYREAVLADAPEIAQIERPARGVFLSYDFHLSSDGPKLQRRLLPYCRRVFLVRWRFRVSVGSRPRTTARSSLMFAITCATVPRCCCLRVCIRVKRPISAHLTAALRRCMRWARRPWRLSARPFLRCDFLHPVAISILLINLLHC